MVFKFSTGRNFKAATDALTGGVRMRDLAKELDVSPNLLFRARMKKNGHYRSPPEGWEKAAAKLARKQAKELERLATRLGG